MLQIQDEDFFTLHAIHSFYVAFISHIFCAADVFIHSVLKPPSPASTISILTLCKATAKN